MLWRLVEILDRDKVACFAGIQIQKQRKLFHFLIFQVLSISLSPPFKNVSLHRDRSFEAKYQSLWFNTPSSNISVTQFFISCKSSNK